MNTIRDRFVLIVLVLAAAVLSLAPVQSASRFRAVLLVSVDGLRPDYVTRADEHGLRIPNLLRLMREGVHASRVRGVLPSVTYSSHTTLLTGVSPAAHGIHSNRPFNPSPANSEVWYWFTEDIRVPTLWDAAARAGYVTGSVSWPVSVGASSIRFNIPEYARTRTVEDLKMVRALATPGLLPSLEQNAGAYIIDVNEAIPRDWARTRYAAEMLRQKHTRFLTVHLAALDHVQHENGPFTSPALAALEEIDKMLGALGGAARAEDPNAAVCIVSDHGFASVDHVLKLDALFVKAGLITLKKQGDTLATSGIQSWKAMPWPASGSAAVVLKDPRDEGARAEVRRLLETLASDPANGIALILDRQAISKLGGAPMADFWVDLRPGFTVNSSLAGPPVGTVSPRGTHGYSPSHHEMGASFLLAGAGIRKGADLGEIDMRSVAPTLAKVLGVPFPSAELPPLDVEHR